MSSEPDPEALQQRIDELEATVQKMLPGRRAVLAGAAGAAAGAFGMQRASNVGEAADGTAVGQIGTSSEKVNVVAHDVTSDSVDTDRLNNTPYASEFSGATLADRIQAAIGAGESGVRVARQESKYTWYTNVQPPQDFSILFDDYYQPVEFEGTSGSGESDIAIEPDRRLHLRGGWFETTRTSWQTSDRWTWVKPPNAMSDSVVNVPQVAYFEEAIHLPGNDAIAWNGFDIDRLQENYRGVIIDANGGYSNENRFRIGHGIYASSGFTTGNEILIDNKQGRNNSIIDSDLGMADGTMVRVDTGGEMRLVNCRLEDTTGNSTFIETTANATTPAVTIFGWNKALEGERSKLSLADEGHLQVHGDQQYAVYRGSGPSGRSLGQMAGTSFAQSINTSPSAPGTLDDYIFLRTSGDSYYSFSGLLGVQAENSSGPERYSGLYYVVGKTSNTTATLLAEEATGSQSTTLAVDYSGGDHTIQVAAESGTWSSAPDEVTVTGTFFGRNVTPEDKQV
jgi:hypothetical protein